MLSMATLTKWMSSNRNKKIAGAPIMSNMTTTRRSKSRRTGNSVAMAVKTGKKSEMRLEPLERRTRPIGRKAWNGRELSMLLSLL